MGGIKAGPPGGVKTLGSTEGCFELSQPAESGAGVGKWEKLSTCQTHQDGCCRRPSSPEGDGKGHVAPDGPCTQQAESPVCLGQPGAEQLWAMGKNRVDERVQELMSRPHLLSLPPSQPQVQLGPETQNVLRLHH